MRELIERTRLAAKILRDIGGQSEMAATVDEAAAALEAALGESDRWRDRYRAAIDQARGKGVAGA